MLPCGSTAMPDGDEIFADVAGRLLGPPPAAVWMRLPLASPMPIVDKIVSAPISSINKAEQMRLIGIVHLVQDRIHGDSRGWIPAAVPIEANEGELRR